MYKRQEADRNAPKGMMAMMMAASAKSEQSDEKKAGKGHPASVSDETTILPYLLLAGAALLFAAGFGILYIRKRKKDK